MYETTHLLMLIEEQHFLLPLSPFNHLDNLFVMLDFTVKSLASLIKNFRFINGHRESMVSLTPNPYKLACIVLFLFQQYIFNLLNFILLI